MTKAGLVSWLVIDIVLNTMSVLAERPWTYVIAAVIFFVLARQTVKLFVNHAEECAREDQWTRNTERLLRQKDAAWEKETRRRLEQQRKKLVREFVNLENRLGRRFR